MTSDHREVLTTQVYQVFIKATPEAIWDAITKPEFSSRYFYEARNTVSDRRILSLGLDDETLVDEPVLEFDPPRKLVYQWRAQYDPAFAAEEPSRVTWEIESQGDGVCMVTLIHDRLEGAPLTAQHVAGAGWMLILSGLKTLLETGSPLMATSRGE
jgi:uncharacterized protein YndB with AHSA1/START domain